MALSEQQKSRVEKNIQCYHKKFKNENSYIFIYDNKYGVLFRSKGEGSALIISTEKNFFILPKNTSMKKIPYKQGVRKILKIFKKQYLFPVDLLGFGTLLVEAFTEEIKKIKSQVPEPIKCNGG